MPRRILCVLSCALLTLSALRAAAASKQVSLATGDVELRQLNPSTGTARSVSVEARSGASYAADRNSRRLFLFSYSEATHAAALQSALREGGADILSYIPGNALLVAATTAVASQVSSRLGAAAAALGPQHKTSPEWAPLMTSSSASSTRGMAPPPHDGSAAAARSWLLASQTRAQAAQLLSQLRTLSRTAPTSSPGTGGPLAAAAAAAAVRYGVAVEVLPGLSDGELAAIGTEWPVALAAELRRRSTAAATGSSTGGGGGGGGGSTGGGGECSPVVESPPEWGETPAGAAAAAGLSDGRLVAVYLCEQDIAPGVVWLAELEAVQWVAPLRAVRTSNARSGILLQTGQISIPQYQDVTAADRASSWPYWAAGLEGQGEIVGLADTGLDVEGCAFQDVRFNGSYAAALADPSAAVLGIASYAQIPEHRKVAQYARINPAGDSGDGQGHGTLVCGSVAGAVLTRPEDPYSNVVVDEATGAAPRARLSVVDTQGGDGGGGSVLWVPYDSYRLYLPLHRAAGAFITSDSWGSSGGSYESQSQSFDRFLWENPDFISLLAAGNTGTRSLSRHTINEPAIAKNVVAVGAGSRLASSYGSRSLFTVQGVRLDGSTLDMPVYPLENYQLPTLAAVSTNRGQRPIPMVVALPVDACTPLRNAAATLRSAVVLATRSSGCSFAQQARNVEAAGAAALVLVQTPPFNPEVPYPTNTKGDLVVDSLAVSMLDWDVGLNLIGFMYEGGKLNFTRRSVPVDSKSVAAFSSWGPTPDGRIKPDIIAPGELITSAEASTLRATYDVGGGCSTREYAGTSAATPLAAGHVALMRQYLRSGFYPTGSPADPLSAPFTPSGMLLKALLIAGAASLEGGWAMNAGRALGAAPDGYQGWGRLNLAGSLPLLGFTDPRVRLQLVDRGEFRKSGESVSLEGLTATGTGPVSAVLAYYDYPADPNALTALVNNLDLQLWVNDIAYLGNNREDSADPSPDSVNTVERVRLSAPPVGGVIRITVTAPSLPSLVLDPDSPQRWALAVVGHFEGSLRSDLNPAWLKLVSMPKPPQPPPPSPPPELRGKRPPKRPSPPPKRPPASPSRSPPPPPPPPPRRKPLQGRR